MSDLVNLLKYDEETGGWFYLNEDDIKVLDKYAWDDREQEIEKTPFMIDGIGRVVVLNSEKTWDRWRGAGHEPLGPPMKT